MNTHKGSTAASVSKGSRTTSKPQSLSISPEIGEFINFDTDTTYVLSFTIRNCSPTSQIIRFVAPQKAKTFRLVNQSSVRLAPGIAQKVEVEFSTHTTEDYEDSFAVLNDRGERFNVPLSAKSVPELVFPPSLDFGRAEHHRVGLQKVLSIVNRGRKAAQVSLVSDSECVSATPAVLEAKALSSTDVTVELSRLTPGTHTWKLSLLVDGEEGYTKDIAIVVDVIDGRSSLFDPSTQKEVVSVCFQPCYEGAKKKYKLIVINGSENSTSFAFQLTNESLSRELPPFRFEPEQGRLQPREHKEILVLFEPMFNPQKKGWSSQEPPNQAPSLTKYEGLFSLLFVETEEVYRFHVVGQCTPTVVHVSPTVLDFGQCNTNDHRDLEVVIKNYVEELPLAYSFDPVSQFRINPSTGFVPAGGTSTVAVRFQPNRMGAVSEEMNISFNKTVSRTVRLLGHASGKIDPYSTLKSSAEKLPQDFVRPVKHPDVRRPSHTDAQANTLGRNETVADVDIGMTPGQDLVPPEPATIKDLRRALKSVDKANKNEDNAFPVFDLKTLIKRRYEEAPSNAMERRDCRRELAPRDLLRVLIPVKEIDFGLITKGATSVRSFYVYNGTAASILVSMPDEQSFSFEPTHQVIPSHKIAQFDVVVKGSAVQSLSQVLHYLVNQKHKMRFTVHAEIVPVEVSLTADEVVLTLDSSAEQPIVRYPVQLINRGNSSAPYRWKVPNKSCFSVQPPSGIIAPLSKVTSEVIFSPPSGTVQTEETMVLDVEGATSLKKLKVIGVIEPTKCSWGPRSNGVLSLNKDELTVSLHRIPVGIETSFTASLVCVGGANTFYSLDNTPEWLEVAPVSGRVCKGEGEDLVLTVKSDKEMTIAQPITCNIRGTRKSLRIQISAEVVAPPLYVTSPAKIKGEVVLDFGQVYAGTESNLSLVLTNNDSVAGLVRVDMGQLSDYTIVSHEAAMTETTSEDGSDSLVGSVWFIHIAPKGETTVEFVCRPTAPRELNPAARSYVSWKQVGGDSNHPLPPIVLVSETLPPVFRLSKTSINFPSVVAGSVPRSNTFTVRNVSGKAAAWSLVAKPNPNGDKSHFLVEPNNGTLEKDATQEVTLTFLGDAVGEFAEQVFLYVGEEHSRPCSSLVASASATKPQLFVDRKAVRFPCTPLHSPIQETIHVVNDGYKSVDVTYKGSVEDLLLVEFPEGHNLSENKQSIPVRLTFKSGKPVVLSSSITLNTTAGEPLHIQISGAAVNSILSTFEYVSRMSLLVSTTEALSPLEASPFVTRVEGFLDNTDDIEPEYYRVKFEQVENWMNGNLLRNPCEDLLTALQESHGEVLYDVLQRLCGKRPKRADSESVKGKTTARNQQILAQKYSILLGLLQFLKSNGCCLSGVEPSFLLPFREAVTRGDLSDDISEESFNKTAKRMWLVLMVEVIRVFFLSTITATELSSFVSDDQGYKTCWGSKKFKECLGSSNVYSFEESMLLQFVRTTCAADVSIDGKALERLRLESYDDLRDARPLLVTLARHIPFVEELWLKGETGLVQAPSLRQEYRAVVMLLFGILEKLGMHHLPTPDAYLDFDQADFVLFVSSVCLLIRRYSSFVDVLFDGKLLSNQEQLIEVQNTSTFSRVYNVFLSNPAFVTAAEDVTVQPNSSSTVSLCTSAKYFRKEEGWCVLSDHTSCLPSEQVPLVFRLISSPNSEPLKTIHITTNLYDPLNEDIFIENPFKDDCVVAMHVSQEVFCDGTLFREADVSKMFGSAFLVSVDVLPLRKVEGGRLAYTFAPLSRGVYKLKVTFRAENFGEFSYLIIGTCTLPRPQSENGLVFRVEKGETSVVSLPIKPVNTLLEKTCRLYEEHNRQTRRFKTLPSPPSLVNCEYEVSFVGEDLSSPNPFLEPSEKFVTLTEEAKQQTTTFRFKPKQVGTYKGFILLSSPVDVRVLPFCGECVTPGEKGVLKFSCAARRTITQEIAITNNSSTDWSFKATLSETVYFSGLKDFVVQQGKMRAYALQYHPPWITKEEVKEKLELYNATTGQKHVFDLFGKAEAPLAEEDLSVSCQAREKVNLEITVPNVFSTDCKYIVESDLSFAKGPGELMVLRGATGRYHLAVTPTVGGEYDGKIIFRSEDRYVWYNLHVAVAPPEKEGTVRLKTDERTGVAGDVTIGNPTEKTLVFDVRQFGPGVTGASVLEVEPSGTSVYTFFFRPPGTGEFEGRLSFCNEEVGEYWYELNMTVDEAPPENIEFDSPLGVVSTAHVRLFNNSSKEEKVVVNNPNKLNFAVSPPNCSIAPLSDAVFKIEYTPTTVGVKQENLIALTLPNNGVWRYLCTGEGTAPLPAEAVSCSCDVGSSSVVPIEFKNTLETEITLYLAVTGDGAFQLPESAPPVKVPPGATTTLSVAFSPRDVGSKKATVEVSPREKAHKSVVWRFPLIGIAQWREATQVFRLKCTARAQTSETIHIRSPFLPNKSSVITFQPDEKQRFSSALTSSLSYTLDPEPTGDEFRVNVKLSPLRPFSGVGNLIVSTPNEGTVSCRLFIDVTPAEPDDVIQISGTIGQKSVVQFDLYNVLPFKSKFIAYFTESSSREFSVTPIRGVLNPFNAGQRSAASATKISVEYFPRAARSEGLLVVDTEEMQWSFRVVGKAEQVVKRKN